MIDKGENIYFIRTLYCENIYFIWMMKKKSTSTDTESSYMQLMQLSKVYMFLRRGRGLEIKKKR